MANANRNFHSFGNHSLSGAAFFRQKTKKKSYKNYIFIDNHLVERAKFGCSVAVAFHHRGDAVGIADKMKIFQNIVIYNF